jgi:hypothetical protein
MNDNEMADPLSRMREEKWQRELKESTCAFCDEPAHALCHACWKYICAGCQGSDDARCVRCIFPER